MSEYGHVKISRRAYASDPFWTEPRTFSKWEAWEWMIQEAAWRDRRRVIGMRVVPLARGEFLASIRFLAEAWGWKKSRVHDFLKLLVEMGRISGQRETQDGTVYVLVNYDAYQSVSDTDRTADRTVSGQQADSERTPSGQTRSSKAGKARKADGDARKRAHPLPDLWRPNEDHESLAAELGLDVQYEAARMRDWALAEGATKKDWDATFRNWLRKSAEYAAKGGGGRRLAGTGTDGPGIELTDEQARAYGVV